MGVHLQMGVSSLCVSTCMHVQSHTLKRVSLASVDLELVMIWEEFKGLSVGFKYLTSKHLVGSDKLLKVNSLHPLKKGVFVF